MPAPWRGWRCSLWRGVQPFATLTRLSSLRSRLVFDLAMSANPLGAAIVAAVALGGAAYEVYEHWGAIKSFFKDLWAERRGVVSVGLGRDEGSSTRSVAICRTSRSRRRTSRRARRGDGRGACARRGFGSRRRWRWCARGGFRGPGGAR